MLNNKLKALAEARTLVARLESSIAAELKQELAGLPADYGFDSARAFVAAVTAWAQRGHARNLEKLTDRMADRPECQRCRRGGVEYSGGRASAFDVLRSPVRQSRWPSIGPRFS